MTIIDPNWPRAGVWLAREDSSPDLLVVGVPSSRSSLIDSRADLAPLQMRERLDRYSTFDGELKIDFGKVTVRDLGNWAVSGIDPVPLIDALRGLASNLPDSTLKIFIGGDNAITRPLVSAQGDDLSRVGLITFDAHHDVRSLDDGPTNGNPIRGLVEEHGLPGRNIVQIGVHSFSNSETYRRYCDDAGIITMTVGHVEQVGMRETVGTALGRLEAHCDSIYVDVDIDVLDRVFAPGCPGARPGGLTVRQLAEGVSRCAAHPTITAMDFVEVDPTADPAQQTTDIMAHLFLTAVAGFATR
ncbi:MAG: agmatinase family protein [Acidimicrobiia bacterium]